jgi:WXG100 family type VII secretion target
VSVRYTADLEQLASHVHHAEAFVDDLDEALGHLTNVVGDLHLTWKGDAADAHRLAHEEWVRGAEEMKDALSVLAAAARRAHGNYHSAASTNADMWAVLA